ncbi:hypothetical protein OIB37_17270 [Streptomyces sp. NBC_00820]|uniref:hypothetical protein n=1 Tax=Streptomyces sp. NBC_00820 TaxID=2975842 RepID=UPI002ED2E3D5|nr:hypothetical protein OIB37_17270 [Streptomyces sp. NBC_00820]
MRGSAGRGVSWKEAGLAVAGCWLVSFVGYVVIAALDEPGLPVAALLWVGLGQWLAVRHRDWTAVIAAALAGAVTMLGLAAELRPGLDGNVADTLATGFAATVAVLVYATAGRLRVRVADRRAAGRRGGGVC